MEEVHKRLKANDLADMVIIISSLYTFTLIVLSLIFFLCNDFRVSAS